MRNCPAVAKNIEDNLLLKNDFLRYSGYIFQVRLAKAKLLSSIFLRYLLYQKLFKSVHFCVSCLKNRVTLFETRCRTFFHHSPRSVLPCILPLLQG